MGELRFFRPVDFIILSTSLLILSIWVFARSSEASSCIVRVENIPTMTLELNRNQIIEVPGRPGVFIEVKDGTCGFIQSNCPDQVCVHTGFLQESGQSAACLPNQVVLLIEGGENSLDAAV